MGSQCLYPWVLDWHPCPTFLPKVLGTRFSRVTSLSIPPRMEYLRTTALMWMVGTCCLPVARFQESFVDPASLCIGRMLTQEVHHCWGYVPVGYR